MAGHSKWANIKHKKARVDAQRGKLFTKIGRELIMAAKAGGGDPNTNFRLKVAVQKAKEANIPADNIQRAIQRGTGEIEGANYEEIVYEGYAPGGIALLLNITTDNRNRTAAEIRHLFSRSGGNLGESGCVAWMFERKGSLLLDEENSADLDEDSLLLLALEAGAEDVRDSSGAVEIITQPEDFEAVKEKLTQENLQFLEAELSMVPTNLVEISDPELAEEIIKLINDLEENDDVQDVYTNFAVSPNLDLD